MDAVSKNVRTSKNLPHSGLNISETFNFFNNFEIVYIVHRNVKYVRL